MGPPQPHRGSLAPAEQVHNWCPGPAHVQNDHQSTVSAILKSLTYCWYQAEWNPSTYQWEFKRLAWSMTMMTKWSQDLQTQLQVQPGKSREVKALAVPSQARSPGSSPALPESSGRVTCGRQWAAPAQGKRRLCPHTTSENTLSPAQGSDCTRLNSCS